MATQNPPVTETPPAAPATNEDLWSEALKLLHPDDNEEIRLKAADKLVVLNEVLTAANDKREQCKNKQWKYKKRDGTVIVLRDVFDKIVKWLNKLKKIGDFVAELDSVHLAIPWAAIKFFLEISTGDSEKLAAVYDGIEMITNLVGQYAIFEELYLRETSKASELLKQAIIKLYASVLTYLAEAKRYYAQNTAKRIAKNVLQITDHDVEQLSEDIRSEQVSVDEISRLIDAEYLRKTNDGIKLVSKEARTHNADLRKALVDLDIPLIHDQLSELTKDLERKKKLELLNWISSEIPYSKHHESIRSGRLEGSGLWLLEQPQYTLWKKSKSSSLLWLHGNPGSGKSRLMSLLVDTLKENKINPQAGSLAYVYCARNANEEERGKPVEIIRSILRQLSCPKPNMKIQDVVVRKYQELQEDGFEPRDLKLTEAKTLILELLRDNPATIIIDALDECVPDKRHLLLDAIEDLLGNDGYPVKIVVSSRDNHEDISRHMGKPSNFHVDAGNNKLDIERFVQLEVARSIQDGRLLGGRVSPKLEDTLIKTLTNGAQGMFLWVALQLQNLCNPRMKFEKDVLQELKKLPKELGDIWSTIYDEVNSAGDTTRRIANTALQWLLCARGRLSAQDFITAVSFDEAEKPEAVDTTKLLDICGNLVVLDTELDVFRFTHLSVREFLEARPDFTPKLTHATAAEICLNTLLTRDWLSSEITWQKATLYQYATLYWASHIESCGKDYHKSKIRDALTQLFTRDERVTPWFAKWLLQVESASQTLGWDDPLKDKIEQSLSHPETCLFTACTFGFSKVVEQLSKTSPFAIRRVNAKGATGLHLASQFGHIDIVKILLDGEIEVDAKDEGMETALARACSAGHEDIVSLLLNRGADRSVEGKKYGTALQAASLHGHKEVVVRLLEGVDVDAEGGQFGTPLQAASLRGHNNVVEVLLNYGAKVNALGGEYANTAEISSAKPNNPDGVSRVIEFLLRQQELLEVRPTRARSPQSRHETIVQLLLDGGIDINIQIGGFGPALHAASRGGHVEVVRTLLAAGADVTAEGGAYGSVLQAAAIGGSDGVVQLLLEAGADVNVQCGVYSTPLQAACRYQHEKVIQTLLSKHADVNAQGGVYGSALQAAARTGSKAIIKLLLDRHADVNAQGGTYNTALQAASAEGFEQIAQLLLENGADVNLRGGKYYSALQAASGAGYLRVVRLLVENSAKFDTALQIASLGGHDDIVAYFLSKGADPNTQGQSFGTALQNATAAGQEKVVQLLIDRGADANGEGEHFGTALQVAAAAGNKQLVRLLLDRGGDPSESGGTFGIRSAELLHELTSGNDFEESLNCSALEAAASGGYVEVVQMLLDELPRFSALSPSEPYGKSRVTRSLNFALHYASRNGHLDIVRLLVDIRPNFGLASDDLPLRGAAEYGHKHVVRLLLERSATTSTSELGKALLEATKGNHETTVRLLLDNGADVSHDGGFRGTALHIASYGGREGLVRLFLNKGADPKVIGSSRATPLILASCAGHNSVVKLLLQRGANPNMIMRGQSDVYEKVTQYGTALQAAVYGGHEKVIRLLIEHPSFIEKRERIGHEVVECRDTGSDEYDTGDNGSDNDDDDIFHSPPQSPTFGDDDELPPIHIRYKEDDGPINIKPSIFGTALQRRHEEDDGPYEAKDGAPININTGIFGTALQAACFTGNERLVKNFIDFRADPNIQGGKYGTALQAATCGGFQNIVQLLLDHGADVNIEAGMYGTALQAAAFRGDENLVKLLINAGADVRSQGGAPEKAPNRWDPIPPPSANTVRPRRRQNGKYGTALQAAAFIGNVEIVRLLLDNGADIGDADEHGQTPLHRASFQGHAAVVEALLTRGANINEQDRQGRSALRWAASYGYEKLLGLLWVKGAQMDIQDRSGQTAMHRAAENGHTHVIQKLIEKGLDIEAKDSWGHTPLFSAVEKGRVSTVRFLLQNGALAYQMDDRASTALHKAASSGRHTAIRPLLEWGADINAVNQSLETPLHIAAEIDNYEVPYTLWLYCANIEAKNRQGETALHLAAAQESVTVLTLLLIKGANVHAEDDSGKTALHVAAEHGEEKSVALLLERSPVVDARDHKGKTALHLATENYNDSTKLLLLQRGADMNAQDKRGTLAIPEGREPEGYERPGSKRRKQEYGIATFDPSDYGGH